MFRREGVDERKYIKGMLAGPPRELSGPGAKFYSNNKTKNRWAVLQIVENTYKRGLSCLQMQPLMPGTCPDFDGALFNFRIFLKLGAPTCLGPGASCPPAPPPLSAAQYVGQILKSCNDYAFLLRHFGWSHLSETS